ncbi:DUF4142 domain-containing protein [Actinoplanes sp. NEAU-A12]|uniref:DUF4142 domain-containing protein n=1 Tax=Actinoplanes sandaracinus TaxID=3045177 RepID=A0ABT6WPP2_9ACTN|nr:DUF4142 domain-containing protein [Actinoplanes sandaracinus]MDI6101615.1 DUF4142 domain-containing protein [Actinoplanes sandaracinus]
MHSYRIAAALGLAGSLALGAVPAQAAPAPTPRDVAFVHAAHQGNLAEIAAGQVAWKKTTDPVVKNLAATFMRNHIHMDAKLYLTARDLGIRLPNSPTAAQQALTERYAAAAAETFDDYYISTQLTAHRHAHKLIKEQLAGGADPAVKDLAEQAVPIIAEHRKLLREAAAQTGGE